MAIFHWTAQVISRSTGRSSVGAAAYRSAQKLYNRNDGVTHDYHRKGGVVHNAVLLPDHAPEQYQDREKLWNAIEDTENNSTRWRQAQTAREIELALPIELNRQDQIRVLENYVRDNFVDRGMCADLAIHDKGQGNPHAHIMLTMRDVTPEGFGKKNRTWNQTANLKEWRKSWAQECNREFERQGIGERIDHRSLEDQGLVRLPTSHLGPAVSQMEKRGIKTDRGDINREIKKQNMETTPAEPRSPEKPGHDYQELYTAPSPEASPSPTPAAQQPTFSLGDLHGQYLDTVLRIRQQRQEADRLGRDFARFQSEAEDIEERGQNIAEWDSKLQALKQEQDALSPLALGKRQELDRNIERATISRDQAIKSLERDYQIRPDQIPQTVNDLSQRGGQLQREYEKVKDLSPLEDHRSRLENDYVEAYKQAPEADRAALTAPDQHRQPENPGDRLELKNAQDHLNSLTSSPDEKSSQEQTRSGQGQSR